MVICKVTQQQLKNGTSLGTFASFVGMYGILVLGFGNYVRVM